MATIKDVAKKAGVSVATVSAVINKDSDVNVSDKLSQKVKKAVKDLNYRPNRIARALSKQESSIIAYVVPSVQNNFFSQMAHFIENCAFKKDFGVYLCNTHCKLDRVDLYKKNLIENRVAGVIVTLTWGVLESDFIEDMFKEGIPVVGLAGARVRKDISTVTINDKKGAQMGVNYFVKRGHSIIGFIGVKNSRTTKVRLEGYKKSLKENNIEINNDLISLGEDFSREEGYILAEQLLKKVPEMTALFVYNDIMASGVIDKFNNLGINVPGDIEVIGYDNSVAGFIRPKLSTMALPKEKMANIAMELLFDKINKKSSDIYHKKVLPELIIRNSTKK